jgi:hypothetical protein
MSLQFTNFRSICKIVQLFDCVTLGQNKRKKKVLLILPIAFRNNIRMKETFHSLFDRKPSNILIFRQNFDEPKI